MDETVWLSIVSALLSVIGTLAYLGYRDLQRALYRNERRVGEIVAVILAMVSPDDKRDILMQALQILVRNGKPGGYES